MENNFIKHILAAEARTVHHNTSLFVRAFCVDIFHIEIPLKSVCVNENDSVNN